MDLEPDSRREGGSRRQHRVSETEGQGSEGRQAGYGFLRGGHEELIKVIMGGLGSKERKVQKIIGVLGFWGFGVLGYRLHLILLSCHHSY